MQEGLTKEQIEQFIHTGFVQLENAFSQEHAQKVRNILWQDMPVDPQNSSSWTKPVIRLGMYAQPPFVEAANTASLHKAFDQLVGQGRWIPPQSIGTFPIRFPSNEEPGDTGWHVDASFPGADPMNYLEWRINVRSKGRGLLMLFLFSDVSQADAPTRIRVSSHLEVARMLSPAGETGFSFMELATKLSAMPEGEEIAAIGQAGTVYLCHPFLAHAAQVHRGTEPRFLAQPPLLLRDELVIIDSQNGYSPVEEAIRIAL
ncbi:phytanoyl-CoA dioxygenase [Fibrella sp. ES10-3-2-2]|nr:phytanoyl-CoA dioxygenase [Fibrella sp. ES10-3-2-2]